MRLGADSAVLRPGEPVFVPDPADAWHARIVPGVRVSRLGMYINSRNVFRHIDSYTAFHVLTPSAPIAGIPDGMIDRTFSPGTWLPLEAGSVSHMHTLAVSRGAIGGEPELVSAIDFSIDGLGVAYVVAELSKLCTFRTGDVILFADAAIDLGEPRLNTCVEAAIDTEKVLNIRIK